MELKLSHARGVCSVEYVGQVLFFLSYYFPTYIGVFLFPSIEVKWLSSYPVSLVSTNR